MAEPVELHPDSPDSVHELFETFLNEGDLESLVDLYERDAALVNRDGRLVSGSEAIRDYYRSLISRSPGIRMRHLSTIEAGDISVLISDWRISGDAPDGTTFVSSGRTYDIVRRRPDGTWRIAVDNPWGLSNPGLKEMPEAGDETGAEPEEEEDTGC
jgi:ketosteroid isomerase-like protein